VREDRRIVGGEEWQEKVYNRGMEEAPENGKELSHSAYVNGMNKSVYTYTIEPLLSRLMTSCCWADNQKSQIIEDDPKTTC
jgi:hypothetical protein